MHSQITTVFLDLDDTLLDEAELGNAVESTCNAVANTYPRLDALALREANHTVWTSYWAEIAHAYMHGGVTGTEVILEVWRRSLRACGSTRKPILDFAVETYQAAERNAWRLFPDVCPVLDDLAGAKIRLGLITNGASDTQRDKLAVLGLSDAFDHIFISGEVGAAKPSRALFEHALTVAKTPSENAIHGGDNLESDIAGAQSVGMASAWLNRANSKQPLSGPTPTHQIRSLTEIQDLI